MLPSTAPYKEDIDVDVLAEYALTGGQINLVIKNTAYSVATQEEPIFGLSDFIKEIEKEKSGTFDSEKSMGFINS
jgi:hypothetical protein